MLGKSWLGAAVEAWGGTGEGSNSGRRGITARKEQYNKNKKNGSSKRVKKKGQEMAIR